MTSHPNRSRRKDSPARNPTPDEIRQLREEMEMSQTEFARHLYASTKAVQAWEQGLRRMHPALFEYASLLWGFRAVAAARKAWIDGFR